MKRIGLIGGVSPESTVIYYQLLNQAAQQRYGETSSAEVVIHALNFGEMYGYYKAEDWTTFKQRVVDAAKGLALQGCDLVAISSNTTQVAANDAAAALEIPLINLLECLADAMREKGIQKPLVLGTPFVMNGPYYRAELLATYGFETLIPEPAAQAVIDRVIFEELVKGVVRPESRQAYLEIIDAGRQAGADGVILGCTEIGMLIEQAHTSLPVFDTTLIHAAAIAEAAFTPQLEPA